MFSEIVKKVLRENNSPENMLVYHVTNRENALNILENGFDISKTGTCSYGPGIYFYMTPDNPRTKICGRDDMVVLECSVNPQDIAFLDNILAKKYLGILGWQNYRRNEKMCGWGAMTIYDENEYDHTSDVALYWIKHGLISDKLNLAFTRPNFWKGDSSDAIIVMRDASLIKPLRIYCGVKKQKPLEIDFIK